MLKVRERSQTFAFVEPGSIINASQAAMVEGPTLVGCLQNMDAESGDLSRKSFVSSEVTFKISCDTFGLDYVCDAAAALFCEQIMTHSSFNYLGGLGGSGASPQL